MQRSDQPVGQISSLASSPSVSAGGADPLTVLPDPVVVQFDEVNVRRGDRIIVSSLNWTIREGQRWVLLGPNGAGKSTVVDLMAARSHPTAGTVRILDEQLGLVDVFALRPRIGVVTPGASAAIPRRESVRDTVMTAAWGVSGRWREGYDESDVRRAEQSLQLMGVGQLAERTFGTLSEGERKRVEIARALMTDPELLILDEPAAGLDLGAREDLIRRLEALGESPNAPVVILVTHHVEEIPPGFTHALAMKDGRVQAAGEIASVIRGDVLSRAFGLPITVGRFAGRYFATRASTD